jgi:hypothetical protein
MAPILAYKAFLWSPVAVNISSAFENSGSALDQFFSQAKRSASANMSAAVWAWAFTIAVAKMTNEIASPVIR